jgi:hypothetical protein
LEIKNKVEAYDVSDQLTVDDYSALMKNELEDLAGYLLRALISIEENRKRIARWYDKKVKVKEFSQGDLVWKCLVGFCAIILEYNLMNCMR